MSVNTPQGILLPFIHGAQTVADKLLMITHLEALKLEWSPKPLRVRSSREKLSATFGRLLLSLDGSAPISCSFTLTPAPSCASEPRNRTTQTAGTRGSSAWRRYLIQRVAGSCRSWELHRLEERLWGSRAAIPHRPRRSGGLSHTSPSICGEKNRHQTHVPLAAASTPRLPEGDKSSTTAPSGWGRASQKEQQIGNIQAEAGAAPVESESDPTVHTWEQ